MSTVILQFQTIHAAFGDGELTHIWVELEPRFNL